MARRCLHCTAEIQPPHPAIDAPVSLLVAVLAGYCTSMCQGNAAMTAVVLRTAWWMVKDPAAHPPLPTVRPVARPHTWTIGEVNLAKLGFSVEEAVALASEDAAPGLYEAALRGVIKPGMMPVDDDPTIED